MSFDVNNECSECGYIGDSCECEFDAFKASALQGNGYNRRVHVADGSESNAKRFYVFAFGAYASTLVAVGFDAGYRGVRFPDLESALDIAAEHLRGVAPGVFTEPDIDAARDEMLASGDLSAEEYADRECDDVSDKVWQHAATDLTYTESGYIASWEWTILSENATRAEVLEMAGH